MAPAVVARYAAPLHCAIDGTVVFHWAAEWHDLQRFASKQHMENCDFDGAQPLAAVGDAGTTTSFYLACATPGEEIHVGCSVADHCAQGQKLSIHVSPSVHALAADGSPLLHVDSYARVMKLLGHTIDAEGFVHLTRGFQTDHLAETSLDFVWCALRSACPSHPTLALVTVTVRPRADDRRWRELSHQVDKLRPCRGEAAGGAGS